ncbi:MAG TPA: chemotaxis protein CheC [Polyangia bacterium]|nr:chemotaxis protein CheC [Polyangia bacterium]
MTASTLSPDKLDALQELVNMGMGKAGAALAEVLGAFVELAVPALDLADRRQVATMLEHGSWANDREVEAVRQRFFGALMGESVMVFDNQAHAELSDLLGHGPDASATERQEALLDLANVVIGACVNGIAEPLNEAVSFAPPARLGGRAEVRGFMSRESAAFGQGLVVNVDFKLEARAFFSRVLVFLPEESIRRIDLAITQLLDGLAAS